MQQPQQSVADPSDPRKGAPMTLGRIGRMILFFLSFGFLFPKVLIEGMDLTKIQEETMGNLYKK